MNPSIGQATGCMTKISTILGLLVAILCFGCVGLRDSRLEPQRQALAATYRDQTRPMTERMEAFDDLIDTFTSGTPESTLDRFVGWPVADTKSRISGYFRDDGVYVLGNTFSLHLNAPDGSDRWITMTGDKVD
ncbi:hypothetical protein [Pedosphaera parvula]|uniref:Uncharacterized protein n=1 Tax=Pedosphaera parvula (strain Ellin514) TaxID=320771 RepID=B9XKU3_PEDPL|nr:hypothetical protein [Pedosphaera parvula]EEF59586.1 hypothetical protein Cflav_PD2493 [Pedosphaera parvula Ellin514]